ncbi:50S ribosomal protein L25/general stress protein Ctc [Alkalilimnicola ehrlichii]|uniref:Large ribosomal subunit protein bL25 n=1 Tax=Alkalilimnicola ehrlichii TaxID=351052 RepID=A0A3E0X1A1_9GAMM|nr:50S ribosomal protein L25/general stress protein Ctc [Alkalilimnicola ehrlichii]RFA31299.1 50S ribosomal protein L25/general stress protein Ctc [Alkalilimnicola ehrlichii]RFA39429.1 50S ribosomal protein L25/general stress protein Ctc [Alkalilimnicola ehrlichii]
MTIELKLDAEKRTDLGKGASRRLRRAKKIPAILYGGKKKPVSLTVPEQQLLRLLEEEAFYSQIITVDIEGKSEKAILKDLQRHPYKPLVQHMDLQRVLAGTKLTSHVPLHFLNEEAPKKAGGVLHHDMIEVEIECLPKDLPPFIEVDCAALKPGTSLHLSDLKLPKGVSIPALAQGPEHDVAVVSVSGAGASGSAEGEEGEEA